MLQVRNRPAAHHRDRPQRGRVDRGDDRGERPQACGRGPDGRRREARRGRLLRAAGGHAAVGHDDDGGKAGLASSAAEGGGEDVSCRRRAPGTEGHCLGSRVFLVRSAADDPEGEAAPTDPAGRTRSAGSSGARGDACRWCLVTLRIVTISVIVL